MKKENPQEILNEILLRMNYDSKKTLSENLELIYEQTTYYYDANGYLKNQEGPYPLPKGAVLASKAYPSLKSGEYPNYWYSKFLYDQAKTQTQGPKKPTTLEEIQEFQDFLDNNFGFWVSIPEKNYYGKLYSRADLGYGIFGPNTNRMWDRQDVKTKWKNYLDLQKIRRTYVKPVQSDALGKQGSFPKSLGLNKTQEELKLIQKSKEQAQLSTEIEAKYREELKKIWQQYPPMVRPDSYTGTDIESYTKMYNERERLRNKAISDLNFKFKKTKLSNFVEYNDGDLEIPESSEKAVFTKEDFNSIESIKKAFYVVDLNDYDLFELVTSETSGPAFYQKGGGPIIGENHSWIWSQVKGQLKYFKLPPPYDGATWKKRLWYNRGTGINVSQGYYTKDSEGKFNEYSQYAYRDLTFLEEWGPLALNALSFVVMFTGLGAVTTFLIQAGLDIAAASIQHKMGENLGAAVSVILALTPLVSMGIKVEKSLALSLAKKFENAKTAKDVLNVAKGLSKTELETLDALNKTKAIDKVKNAIGSTKGKQALDDIVKANPIKSPIGRIKTQTEIATTAAVVVGTWDIVSQEEFENQSHNEQLRQIFLNLSKADIFNDEESKELQKDYANMQVETLESELDKKIAIIEEGKLRAQQAAEKELDIKNKQRFEEINKKLEDLEKKAKELKPKVVEDMSKESTNQSTGSTTTNQTSTTDVAKPVGGGRKKPSEPK